MIARVGRAEGWGRISSHTGIMNSTSASGPGSGAAARMGNVLLPMVIPRIFTFEEAKIRAATDGSFAALVKMVLC